MTLTKEKLADHTVRLNIESIARSIHYYSCCYNAVPAFPVNDEQRDMYLNCLMEQCKAMEEVLKNG